MVMMLVCVCTALLLCLSALHTHTHTCVCVCACFSLGRPVHPFPLRRTGIIDVLELLKRVVAFAAGFPFPHLSTCVHVRVCAIRICAGMFQGRPLHLVSVKAFLFPGCIFSESVESMGQRAITSLVSCSRTTIPLNSKTTHASSPSAQWYNKVVIILSYPFTFLFTYTIPDCTTDKYVAWILQVLGKFWVQGNVCSIPYACRLHSRHLFSGFLPGTHVSRMLHEKVCFQDSLSVPLSTLLPSFLQMEELVPGILLLVNHVDWADFISHGGVCHQARYDNPVHFCEGVSATRAPCADYRHNDSACNAWANALRKVHFLLSYLRFANLRCMYMWPNPFF